MENKFGLESFLSMAPRFLKNVTWRKIWHRNLTFRSLLTVEGPGRLKIRRVQSCSAGFNSSPRQGMEKT
eukprot:scaffold18138_cov128-Cylindrotheca_fusiformis.AAC.5